MNYIEDLIARFPELEVCKTSIVSAFNALLECVECGNTILLCGNGGSAADCDHWAGELLKGFKRRRPVQDFPSYLGLNLQVPIKAIPLTQFSALSTAYINDVNANFVFAQLTLAFAGVGDILVCISTSGNAKNVVAAADVARRRGSKVISLTGQSGGVLKDFSDITIMVPRTETFLIQELHLPIYHALSLQLEAYLFHV